MGARKKAYIRRRNRLIPQSLQLKTFKIKRDIEETFILNATAPPDTWTALGNTIYRNNGWSLGNLGDTTDIGGMFRQYRILGARVRYFFSSTNSTSDQGSFSNSQILVRMAPNQKGETEVLNQLYWTSVQAKKYRLCLNGGRPLDIYMPLYQQNEVKDAVGNATTMMKPKFCPMENKTIKHFGMNTSFERVDGQPFSTNHSNYQYCKTTSTIIKPRISTSTTSSASRS